VAGADHLIERRRDDRIPVNASGRVWYGPQYDLWADCIVRNLSRRGARIEIPAVYKLPRRLVIAYGAVDTVQLGVLKWHRGDAAGIAFEAESAFGSTRPPLERILAEWRDLTSGT
jgi:hypothetical protein